MPVTAKWTGASVVTRAQYSAIVAFICAFFLKEPEGSFAEHHEGEEEVQIESHTLFAEE